MIIVAGARNAGEAEWLFANGVGEVYCGLVGIPNHRRDSLSVKSGREFLRVIDLAKSGGRKALLLVNEICSPEVYGRLAGKVRDYVGYGAAGVVIKELSILDFFRDSGIKADYILSSLALVFNSFSLDFFRGYGIKRVILPAQLPPSLARGIVGNRYGLQAEMFYYPAHFCHNVDPLCVACRYKPCKVALDCGGEAFFMPAPGPDGRADMMYDGHHLGIKYLKISRTLDFGDLKRFVAEARKLAALLDGGISRKAFRGEYRKVYSSNRN